MIQFYAPLIEEGCLLPENESMHCCRVLRMKKDDIIYVVDGKGKRFTCKITDPHPKKTAFEIISFEEELKPDFKIKLAIAPTKNSDRIDWLVEKCVEIGIDEIIFVRCERSERKDIRLDRIEKVMVSAMKQSLKYSLPALVKYDNVKDFLEAVSDKEQKFMGYCAPDIPKELLAKNIIPAKDVLVFIGPEGDFTPMEVTESMNSGFVPVTFGEMRLRTETAGLYAVTAIHVVNSLI